MQSVGTRSNSRAAARSKVTRTESPSSCNVEMLSSNRYSTLG
ncbi:Uncharacterised protein [Mycobacterium tuberculosis]|nr:Uncharacterised protein [Mycobacterium tuberculosis]